MSFKNSDQTPTSTFKGSVPPGDVVWAQQLVMGSRAGGGVEELVMQGRKGREKNDN